MDALVKNVADKKQVKQGEQKERFTERVQNEELRELLKLKGFRNFAWRYLSACGVFKLSKDPSGSETYFNEGKRSVGLKLMSEITMASPEAYLQMMKDGD